MFRWQKQYHTGRKRVRYNIIFATKTIIYVFCFIIRLILMETKYNAIKFKSLGKPFTNFKHKFSRHFDI